MSREDIVILAPTTAEACVLVYINDNDCGCRDKEEKKGA